MGKWIDHYTNISTLPYLEFFLIKKLKKEVKRESLDSCGACEFLTVPVLTSLNVPMAWWGFGFQCNPMECTLQALPLAELLLLQVDFGGLDGLHGALLQANLQQAVQGRGHAA